MSTANATTVTVRFDPTANSQQADVIGPATTHNAGVMTAAQVHALEDAFVVEDFTIYVNESTGSDSNTGASPTEALQTADAAFSKSPSGWRGSAVIQFAEGTYPFTDLIRIGSPIGPGATPLQILGTPVDTGLGELTALGGSADTGYIAVAATVLDDQRGAYLRNTTTGGRALITGNTPNTPSPGQTTFDIIADGIAVTPGDVFIIERPGTIFQAPPFAPVDIHAEGEVGFGMRDVKFQGDPASFLGFIPLAGLFGFNFFEAVEFDGGDIGRGVDCLHGTRFNFRSEPIFWGGAPVNPFSFDRALAGFYMHAGPGGAMLWNTAERASGSGALVCDETVVNLGNQSNLSIDGISSINSTVFVFLNSSLSLSQGSMDGDTGEGLGTVDVSNQSTAFLGNFNVLDISGSLADAVYGAGQANLLCYNLEGSGNAGVGVAVDDMSLARVGVDGTSTTVTGGGGNTRVGATVKAYGALPFTEPDTLNRIQ